jgi:hypothetical protein
LLLISTGKATLKEIRESYYLSDIYEVLETIDLIADAEDRYMKQEMEKAKK